MEAFLYFLTSVAMLALILVWLGVVRVPEGKVKVVERFGRYQRTLHPGINVIIPLLDRVKRDFTLYTVIGDGERQQTLVDAEGGINMAEQILDPREFDTIASDNAVVKPDVIAYFRIIDARKAVYGVNNLGESLLQLLETTLRQEVGKLDSDSLIASRDVLGAKIQEAIERASEPWGTKILRVEIQHVRFSDAVQGNLTKAREAELSRRAQVVGAQQFRDTEILKAEGDKRATILRAEGEYEAARLKAEADFLLASRRLEGEAQGARALSQALRENPEAVIAIRALEAQMSVAESLGKSRSSMILPADMAGLVGVVGAIKGALGVMNGQTARLVNGSRPASSADSHARNDTSDVAAAQSR